MSTRRARIKAVAALPQRRKNAESADSKKKDQAKELAENLMKSPKVRRTSVDKHSPARPALPSPRQSPRALRRTPDVEKVASDWKVPVATDGATEKHCNTPLRDKTDTNRPAAWRTDIFVSPQSRASPLKRRSPIVRTPVIEVEVGVEKHITPHKRLLELQDKHIKVTERNPPSPKTVNETAPNSSAVNKNVIESYNSPNTPETPDVMDGIVPLKPVCNAPKPIHVLKNEIISENAEVLFDPIVPLPSPTKVRHKLRPVPRLGPMRRNSIPGSASESEDESRRALHGGSSTPVPTRQRHDSHTSHSTLASLPNRDVARVRNDSVCSSVSQMAPQTPAAIGSPLKEKNVSKVRRLEVSRRMAAMRRRKESMQRDKLTMFDLIFYNPMTNPIIPDQDEINANEANKKEEQRKVQSKKEEVVEEPAAADVDDSAAPVPQIKLGPNGEIILDEQSLVIQQSEQRKLSESVVREGAWMSSTSRVYRRTPKTADWNNAETVRFYRALAAIGTDFSLMVPLFPGRSRRDLKLKFKKEEKTNLAQIDKALRSVTGWDASRLQEEFEQERQEAAEQNNKRLELQKARKAQKEQDLSMKMLNVRKSKGSKALGASILPSASTQLNGTVDNLIAVMANKRKPRTKPIKDPIPRNTEPAVSIQNQPVNTDYATVTLMPIMRKLPIPISPMPKTSRNMATLQRTPTLKPRSPVVLNAVHSVPSDITPGSLVVLTVDDPLAPSQKALHTFIKQADGSISSIVLDPKVMSSLVSYVKNDTPKSTMSPSSVQSDRTNTPPLNLSPNKRKRLSSYTITDL